MLTDHSPQRHSGRTFHVTLRILHATEIIIWWGERLPEYLVIEVIVMGVPPTHINTLPINILPKYTIYSPSISHTKLSYEDVVVPTTKTPYLPTCPNSLIKTNLTKRL